MPYELTGSGNCNVPRQHTNDVSNDNHANKFLVYTSVIACHSSCGSQQSGVGRNHAAQAMLN
jgi:hypothetical protein